jgi:hypothetical protein
LQLTRMNLQNIALVFSPGLVRSEKNDPMQMLQGKTSNTQSTMQQGSRL